MSENVRKLVCIVCPIGCAGEVVFEGDQIKECRGFTCKRGHDYAKEETTHPKRMLTSTVRVVDGKLPLLPVVSIQSLPKEMIAACANKLRSVQVKAPVKEGDIVYSNILGLGVDIVASRDMPKK